MHCIHERPQRLNGFSRGEATCPVKDMKDVAGQLRLHVIFRNCIGAQAVPDRFMRRTDGSRSTCRFAAGFHLVFVENGKLPFP